MTGEKTTLKNANVVFFLSLEINNNWALKANSSVNYWSHKSFLLEINQSFLCCATVTKPHLVETNKKPSLLNILNPERLSFLL